MTTLTDYSQQRGYALAHLQTQLQVLRPQLESGITDPTLLGSINNCVNDVIAATEHIEQVQQQTSCWVRNHYVRACIRAIKWGVPGLLILDTIGDGIDTYFERTEFESCVSAHREYEGQYLTGLNNTVAFPDLERLCPTGSDLKLVLLIVKIIATVGSIFGAWAINEYENASTAHQNQMMQLRQARDSDNKFRLFLTALASFHSSPTKEHLHECANAMDDAPGNSSFDALGTKAELLSSLLTRVQDDDVRAELESLQRQIRDHLNRNRDSKPRRHGTRRATGTTGGGPANRRSHRQRRGERGEGDDSALRSSPISLEGLKRVTGLDDLTHVKVGEWWVSQNGSISKNEDDISHSSDSGRHTTSTLPRPVIPVDADASV